MAVGQVPEVVVIRGGIGESVHGCAIKGIQLGVPITAQCGTDFIFLGDDHIKLHGHFVVIVGVRTVIVRLSLPERWGKIRH